jgi:2-deoxystreptamine N-acetyl-D-glucosaminyltransferase/2-deoxystreptamine glucosyltransferase
LLVVPDTIDAAGFAQACTDSATQAFRARHQIVPGRPIVAFVGRIAHEKGWRYLPELATRLAPSSPQFLVVGDGPQRERFERELDAAGVRSAFRITGFVPNEDVAVALRLADVVVMPSIYEELGGTALEALAIGVPVVAFAVGGLRDVIGQLAPSFLVPSGDGAALARRVQEVLSGNDTAGHEIALASRQVARTYHPDRILPPLLAAYRRIARARTRSSAAPP